MRTAALTRPGVVELVDRPRPRAVGDLVVVRVLVAPMCTENKSRRGGEVTPDLGHEAAGVVVDAGSSRLVEVGDRVVVMPGSACGRCRYCVAGEHIYCPAPRDIPAETGQDCGTGTYAEYLLKPDWLLLKVPDDISLSHASAACCLLGPTFNASQRMSLAAADILLVAGSGPVGLGGIMHGITRGARVLALEAHPYRVALARRLGAEVFDPTDPETDARVREATEGWGVTAAIETSGVASSPARLAGLSAPRGRLGLVAWGVDLALPPLPPTGLDVYGCWHWNHQVMGQQMIATIRRAEALLDQAITHRVDLADVSAAMDLQDTGACGKVQLYPHGLDAEGLGAA